MYHVSMMLSLNLHFSCPWCSARWQADREEMLSLSRLPHALYGTGSPASKATACCICKTMKNRWFTEEKWEWSIKNPDSSSEKWICVRLKLGYTAPKWQIWREIHDWSVDGEVMQSFRKDLPRCGQVQERQERGIWWLRKQLARANVHLLCISGCTHRSPQHSFTVEVQFDRRRMVSNICQSLKSQGSWFGTFPGEKK